MKPLLHNISSLAVIVLLATLSACVAVTTPDDSQDAADAAEKIADFDLPAGYSPEFGVHMLGYTIAAYRGESITSHLYLIQSENEADGERLEQMLGKLAPGSRDPNTRLTVIENRSITLHDQEATMIVGEGSSSENVAYREITVSFAGKGGPALLVLTESMELWNQQAVDDFLASIQ